MATERHQPGSQPDIAPSVSVPAGLYPEGYELRRLNVHDGRTEPEHHRSYSCGST
jgi:hypothetical protein